MTGAPLPVLAVVDGRPMADSREVARTFGKNHKDVLRAFRQMECSADFRERNFAPFKIKDLTGESLAYVLMSKTGFAWLVFGFTGSAAAVFKEQYLNRFEAMEETLRRDASANLAPALPQTLPEALRLAADLAETNATQAATIAILEPRSAALTALADTDGTFCVRDAAKALGVPEKSLRVYMAGNGWIYRRGRAEPWCACATRLGQRWMATRVVAVETGHGRPWNRTQARVTSRGLCILAMRLGRPVPPEASADFNLALPAPSRA